MANGLEFAIRRHRVCAQHIREYDRGVADESKDYYIHVNQYTPISHRPPQPDDITIVAAIGLGIVKEAYEPFFRELTMQCVQRGIFVRNFWIADPGCVGKSALANANNLGSEQNWFDHSRDLLVMINRFSKEMRRPLIGLGHSMGGCQIAFLSIIHPHLFHGLLLIEPAISLGLQHNVSLSQARAMTRRREHWLDHTDAEAAIRGNPFYQRWHPDVVSRIVKYSLVSSNNEVVDSAVSGGAGVTTSTPRSMDIALLFKPNYRGVGRNGLDAMSADDHFAVPDADPDARWLFPFYRPEPVAMFKLLPNLRPSVCYLFGDKSPSMRPGDRENMINITGIGVGGSGGIRVGRVAERIVVEGTHFISFDKDTMSQTANFAAEWLGNEVHRFVVEQQLHSDWRRKPAQEKIRMDKIMVEALAEWHPKRTPEIESLVKSRL